MIKLFRPAHRRSLAGLLATTSLIAGVAAMGVVGFAESLVVLMITPVTDLVLSPASSRE